MINKKKKFSLFEIIALFLLTVTTLFLVTSLLFTVIGSFSKYWGKSMFGSGVTTEWYKYVYDYYGHTIGLTLIITFLCVTINIFLGSSLAYVICMSPYGRSRWVKFVEELFSLPLAMPGVAIGLALAQSYSMMRQSGVLILIGHVIFTFPLMFRSVSSAIRSQNLKSIDEAAKSLGAGFFHRYSKVIFPLLRVAIFSGAINVFMTSLGEFNITFFLYTPSLMTFPVGMYESYASLRIEVGSAFTTIFLIIAVFLNYLLSRLNRSETV